MEKIQIKSGGELVSFVKNISEQVSKLRIGDDVDYMGCSRSYIYEKVHIAIHNLEWIIDRIAELHNDKVRCIECSEFTDTLDKDDLCYRCSSDEEWRERIANNY